MARVVRFEVSYEGEGIERGEMSVRDLAPALLALDDLVSEANAVLNPEGARISLRARAVREGSFIVELSMSILDMMHDLANMFRGSQAIADAKEIAEALGLVCAPAAGLIAAVRWMRGRKPTRIKDDDEGVLIFIGDDHLKVSRLAWPLLVDVRVRRALEEATAGIFKDTGITSVRLGEEAPIRREEARLFVAPEPEEEVLADEERVTNVQVVSLSFKEDNKWRLTDGTGTFYAAIEDRAFLARVQNNEVAFRAGDVLRVRMRSIQKMEGENLRTEHIVLEVLEHRPAAVQLRLTDGGRGE